jgi:hypothetical protein
MEVVELYNRVGLVSAGFMIYLDVYVYSVFGNLIKPQLIGG